MALNNFFDIPKWQGTKRDSDAAGPVAAEVRRGRQKATQIIIADDEEVEYREEVPLQVFRGRNLDLRLKGLAVRRPPQLANTVEVRCAKGRCSTRQTVVIAVYPYGFDWFSASRFKPGYYHGRRRDATATAAAHELILKFEMTKDPQALLEQSEFDPFETGNKTMVARFLGPYERTLGGNLTYRNRRNEPPSDAKISAVNKVPWPQMSKEQQLEFLLSSYQDVPLRGPLPDELFAYLNIGPVEAVIRETIPPFWLWGLCEDFDECRNRLRNCEPAREWIANPERTLSNSDAQEERPYALEGEAAAKFFSAAAKHVWEASIVKALAGVLTEETDPNKRRIRRLVIDAVVRIYRDSMFNLARRLRGRRRPIFGQDGYDFVDPEDQNNGFERFLTAEDEEAKWKNNLQRRQPSLEEQQRLFEAARAWLQQGNRPEIVEACGLLAAAAATVTVPADIIAELRQISKDNSNRFEASAAAYALKQISGLKSGGDN